MKIGILGSGRVGGYLGVLWVQKGHGVRFGLRDPWGDKGRALLEAGGVHANVGTPEEAAAFGDTVLVALPWEALMEVLPSLGDLGGKVVVDATNRLRGPASATCTGEDVRLLPGARVIKAFNTIGAEYYANPSFAGEGITIPIAGDDPAAKDLVTNLVGNLGFAPLDVGGIGQSAALEATAFLGTPFTYTRTRLHLPYRPENSAARPGYSLVLGDMYERHTQHHHLHA